jgi:hypothetical protein
VKFGDMPQGLCLSCCIGVCNALISIFTLPNHPLGVEHSGVIKAYYDKEEMAGHDSSCYFESP